MICNSTSRQKIKWLKIFLSVVFLFANFNSFSQSTIDSLKNLLGQKTNLEKQFELNCSLSELLLPKNPYKAASYHKKAFDIANKMNDTSKLIKAYICKGKYNWYQTEHKKLSQIRDTIHKLSKIKNNESGLAAYYYLTGLQLIDEDKPKEAYNKLIKAKKLYTNSKNLKGKAYTLFRIGITYWRRNNYDSTLYYYDKAHKLFEQKNFTYGIGKTSRFKGIVYKRTGEYPKALDAFYKAEKYYTKTGLPNKVSGILGNIGYLHIKLKDYQSALKAFHKSLEQAQNEGNQKLIASRFHNIGFTYFKMGNYNKADSCFNKTLNLYKKIGFNLGIAEAKLDMGKLYYKLGKYSLSIQYLKESIDTFEKKNYQKGLAIAYQYLGKNEYDLDNYHSALKYVQKALKYNNIVKDAELEMELYQLLSVCHKNIGNFKEAYKSYKKFHKLQDSLSNIKSKEKIARIQSKYKTEQKEQEIENLRKEKKIETQRFQRNLLLVTFIMLFIIAILIYNSYHNKKKHLKKLQKANKEMKSAKEKAEKADKLKSAFLANISHEIRTPMNAIVGFSDIIEDPDISKEERQELINQIKENSNVLLHLIDDLIDFSKIESDEINIKTESIFINKLLNEVHNAFATKYYEQQRKTGIQFDLEKQNSDNFQILADKNRLKQVLYNLIDNAFKFTEKGHIRFGYYLKEENPGYIYFFVKDTGAGIPQEKQKEIFKRFSKIKNNNTKHYSGTGLGLAITKALINKMGGEIKLISAKNKGTEFYFYLPLKENINDHK